jgi:predicted transcriptional regulator
MLWQGLPIIRKELVITMINNFGLSQKEAAEKLGVTPSAVSQYISKKRGKIDIINDGILLEINNSAEKIIEHGDSIVPNEVCKICKILRKHNILSFSNIKY